jgi:hypothetical protein
METSLHETKVTPAAKRCKDKAESDQVNDTRHDHQDYTNKDGMPISGRASADDDLDVFPVECIHARLWGLFLLEWKDGTTGWEPRQNIDKLMVQEFERNYKGLDTGIDVLKSRTRKGKRQYLIRLCGRPLDENVWLNQGLMSPQRLERTRF